MKKAALKRDFFNEAELLSDEDHAEGTAAKSRCRDDKARLSPAIANI